MNEFSENCDRCGAVRRVHIMSMFNTEDLCLPCTEKERQHPMYKAALEAEFQATRSGDLNFPGVGKPADL